LEGKQERFLQQFSHSKQAFCHLSGGPLVLPRCIKDKGIQSLVLASPLLAIVLNLASHESSFSDRISKLYPWREEATKGSKSLHSSNLCSARAGRGRLGEPKLEVVSGGILMSDFARGLNPGGSQLVTPRAGRLCAICRRDPGSNLEHL